MYPPPPPLIESSDGIYSPSLISLTAVGLLKSEDDDDELFKEMLLVDSIVSLITSFVRDFLLYPGCCKLQMMNKKQLESAVHTRDGTSSDIE